MIEPFMIIYGFVMSWYRYLFKKCDRNVNPKPLDARENIVYENYMDRKDMHELKDIFDFIRKKETVLKQKVCKGR